MSKQGIRPDLKKVETIQRLKLPKGVTEVKRFMRVVNYFHKSIPQCLVLAKLLLLLMHGKRGAKVKFSWGKDHKASFNALKSHLIAAPIHKFLYFNKKFFLETDASKVGVGAMLSQYHAQDGISDRLLVAYAS